MKVIKKLVIIAMFVIISIGMFLGFKGYNMYKEAIKQETLDQKFTEIKEKKNYTSLAELPKIYLEAVISVEDHRFYNHCGIDIIAIGRATFNDIRTMSFAEGGSTITQQLAKNTYFTQEKKVERKIAEIFMAFDIEKNYSKDEILELYVNTAYYGSEEAMGGGDESIDSETDLDVIYIKKNGSFIKPISGRITSGYGPRTPTNIVSANHAGVDIGANTGADIVASMEGKVEVVSSQGDYGNHLKITNGEISTLYAHCSKIVVNEGDSIKQGQKIAEVGSTGRATGPHLHFEIRRNNKTVDPLKIVEI